MLHSHMTCTILIFHHAHEEDQDITFVLEIINSTNLDEKSELNRHLTY